MRLHKSARIQSIRADSDWPTNLRYETQPNQEDSDCAFTNQQEFNQSEEILTEPSQISEEILTGQT